jgi:hypothetical protein
MPARYSVRSERRLMEQFNYNLLFRWFVGLPMDDSIGDGTVFTKNRKRLLDGNIAEASSKLYRSRHASRVCSRTSTSLGMKMKRCWKVARLKPRNLVTDTTISTRPGNLIEVHDEAIKHASTVAFGDPGNPMRATIGYRWQGGIVGFSTLHYYDWRTADIQCWHDLKNHLSGEARHGERDRGRSARRRASNSIPELS